MYAENDKRLVFVPLDIATVPPSGIIEHIKDYWWVVHPTKGVVYWQSKGILSPQCNSNRLIVEQYLSYPWAEVCQIPSVFRRVNPSDYV